jgi:hypothetical protein
MQTVLEPGDVIRDDGSGPRIEAAPETQYPRMLPHDPGPMRAWETPPRLAAHIGRHFFTVGPRTIIAKWPLRRIEVGGQTLCNTDDALAYAQELLSDAEAKAVRISEMSNT